MTDYLSVFVYILLLKVPEITQSCEWGWVATKQFCVQAVEERRVAWEEAEQECIHRGGHLASIRSEHAQTVIDSMLLYRLVRLIYLF